MDKAKLAGQKGASVWIWTACYYQFASLSILNDGRQAHAREFISSVGEAW